MTTPTTSPPVTPARPAEGAPTGGAPPEDDEPREVAAPLDAEWKHRFVVQRDGRDYVLYAGLLDLGHRDGLREITTTLVQLPTDSNGMMAIVQATVTTERGTYQGLGDANPTNVTRLMVPHLIRMAETRAKARALRDAVNVGVTSFEELGDSGGAQGGGAQEATTWPSTGVASQGGGGAASRPALTGPATAEQLAAIGRLARATGATVDPTGWSAERAGLEIVRLQSTVRAGAASPGADRPQNGSGR